MLRVGPGYISRDSLTIAKRSTYEQDAFKFV